MSRREEVVKGGRRRSKSKEKGTTPAQRWQGARHVSVN